MSKKHLVLGMVFFLYLLGLVWLIEQIRPRGEFFEFTQQIEQQGVRNFLAEKWSSK